MVKKSSLPSKVCPVCKRPFKWRKKWKLVWKEVIYCSKKCRGINTRRISISDPELGRIKQIYDMHNVYWACVNTLSAHPVYIRDEPRK